GGGALQSNLPALSPSALPDIEVLFCRTLGGEPRCSAATPMIAAAGGPPTIAQLVFPGCGAPFDHDSDPEVVAGFVTGTGLSAGKFDADVVIEDTGFLFFDEWTYHFTVTWTDPAYAG